MGTIIHVGGRERGQQRNGSGGRGRGRLTLNAEGRANGKKEGWKEPPLASSELPPFARLPAYASVRGPSAAAVAALSVYASQILIPNHRGVGREGRVHGRMHTGARTRTAPAAEGEGHRVRACFPASPPLSSRV